MRKTFQRLHIFSFSSQKTMQDIVQIVVIGYIDQLVHFWKTSSSGLFFQNRLAMIWSNYGI